VRQYASPAAFRAAIDDRLRAYAARVGTPVTVVRRQAALERLVVRLMNVAPVRRRQHACEGPRGLRAHPAPGAPGR
jgi:hypothetical protein